MTTDEKKNAKNELAVLFPGEKVKLGKGKKTVTVTVTPIPLDKLPEVLGSFSVLIQKAMLGQDTAKIMFDAIGECVEILPHCIDVEYKGLTASAAPPLISKMLDQNLTEEVVGNWKALIKQIEEKFGEEIDQGTAGRESSQKQ